MDHQGQRGKNGGKYKRIHFKNHLHIALQHTQRSVLDNRVLVKRNRHCLFRTSKWFLSKFQLVLFWGKFLLNINTYLKSSKTFYIYHIKIPYIYYVMLKQFTFKTIYSFAFELQYQKYTNVSKCIHKEPELTAVYSPFVLPKTGHVTKTETGDGIREEFGTVVAIPINLVCASYVYLPLHQHGRLFFQSCVFMYMCMSLCMCIYVYACIYVCIYIHIHVQWYL